MSDVRELEVAKGLECLDDLSRTLAAFSKEEAELVRRVRDQRYRAHRAAEDQIAETDARLDAHISEREASCAEEKRRLAERHDARRRRIRRLQNDAQRNLPRLAREARERWLGGLQMQEFVTTRRLAANRQEADEEFERVSRSLAEQAAGLRNLERRAREAFTGYLGFLWMLRKTPLEAPAGSPRVESAEKAQARLDAAAGKLRAFRRLPLPKIFSFVPLPIILVVLAVATFLAGTAQRGGSALAPTIAGALLMAAVLAVHFLGRRQGSALAGEIAAALAEARALLEAGRLAAAADYERECRRIQAEHERTTTQITGEWERGDVVKIDFEARVRERLERRAPRALIRNDALLQRALDRIAAAKSAEEGAARRNADVRRAEIRGEADAVTAELDATEAERWGEIEGSWQREIGRVYARVAELNAIAATAFPEWSEAFVAGWEPPAEFLPATKFARLEADVPAAFRAPGARLVLPGPPHVSIPLALAYPQHGSLLFESGESGGEAVISCLNDIILRLLTTTPPGKLSFTICDPVGLGQNFAGLMQLGDYEESLISRRIWTQADQIEARLADLSQHIEKVIQMYLRNEYATIVEYNAQAGSTAEKFHFLVVADFPANFGEVALKRLQSILASGPRCGVYTLIHWDSRQPLPAGFPADELRRSSICIQTGRAGTTIESDASAALEARLVLDAAPPAELARELVRKIGERSVDAGQVQVPFRAIAPEESEFWRADTTNELRVAIGRTGATKRQMLAIGKGTRQHALVAGKTGSGKSTLFHVMITNLALSCSPEQVEFYLIDFKKGVEFKCYATKRLPHARVVAIESDREFGLSVLQRVDEELRRRGDLFRKLGVQDIAGYQRESGGQPMPRSLLLIDEFQEFFVEDDAIAQGASVLLDRIVRQGRAFGIHVLLGSQTLGGAYSLARATLGQMVIRIALQCNEADAYLIMDDNNPAPRLLSRPGEGIYNDAAGAVEGNSPFQVVWLPEEERDAWLDKVRALAERHPGLDRAPVVFEGNAPADIAENELLAAVLDAGPGAAPAVARAWLGAPNSIKGPTEAAFRRQGGNNLLLVGQRDEAALAMLGNALLALAAQYPVGAARFVFLHGAAPGSADADLIARVIDAVPHEVVEATAGNVAETVADLAAELQRRESEAGVPIFVFVHGLQRFRKLRHEEDFDFSSAADAEPKPGAQFGELVAEGASHGIHLLVSVDTFGSVGRFLSRKALAEFEMRVVFQMSANDSASLIDSPKASALGLHRALFYNEHEGTLETFRPYAAPDSEWLRRMRRTVADPPTELVTKS